jgi:flagellar hook-associated protein 3 FlgL
MMRITLGMMADASLRNIERNQARTADLQNQLTSGSQITKPSDDPIGTARALNFQEGIDQTTQYLTNVDQATSWMNTTDGALGGVSDALVRARELAVQAANGTLSAQDRTAVLSEVKQLQQQVLDQSNAKFGAAFIFSGTRSDQPGYVQALPSTTTPAAYQGNQGQIQRQVSPGVNLGVNADAQAAFDPAFEALNQLANGLSSNDLAAISSSLTSLDTATDSVLTARANVGAKINRLDALKNRLDGVKLNMTGLLSNVKDVDMAAAITNFTMAQTVYQASLKASAQTLQVSLLDYLH